MVCGFIERFFTLGITGGCVADNPATPANERMYCPNDAVTRGQRAVFVTTAVDNLNAGIARATARTPQQIALLKWYEVNRTAVFAVGNSPSGVAFDGAHIWVTNFGGNSVTKLRASDGANQGTFTVGANPGGIAFDGTGVWVANLLSSTVTKLRASDGANQGTFPVGTFPSGIAFDGANIWVANINSNSVMKL